MHKPILIYDGDCGFCKNQIKKLKHISGNALDYAPFQKIAVQFPQIKPEEFQRAVQFIDLNGNHFSGAYAIVKTLFYSAKYRWLLKLYESFLPFRWISEWLYAMVARNRKFFSKLLR